MKNRIYINGGVPQWRGSLHMHTNISDGKLNPADALERYRLKGYNFCAVTDHEIYWDDESFDRPDFLVLAGTEISIQMNERRPWEVNYRRKELYPCAPHKHMHFCCIRDEETACAGECFTHGQKIPRRLDSGLDSWNEQIEYMRRHHNLVILNHPDWSNMEPEMMLAIHGCTAFEVFNSGNIVDCGGDVDTGIWDYCLERGKHWNAVAADDTHRFQSDFAASFTMVSADELSRVGLCAALKRGDFYASTGPLIYDLRVEDGKIKLRCSPARRISITACENGGKTYNGAGDSLLEYAEHAVDPYAKYIRLSVTDNMGCTAWSQPIYIDELL